MKVLNRKKSNIKCINQRHDKNWSMYHGDSVEVIKAMPDDSLHFSIFSPPFSSLYTYSNSERDMGNCRDDEQFTKHFDFLVEELFRAAMPGRLCSFHCMNLPTSKQHHGEIGIRDFRGELIALFVSRGWIFHSEVVIWKDPVTAMQRTKALGLLHKQIKKDSCMSRQGIPDYLVTMRKPGDNPERVAGEFEKYAGDERAMIDRNDGNGDKTRFSIDIWQRYASPVWMDINPSDTLQRKSAREHNDERHICPLQLQVIERAIDLWTNPGDVVLSPFAGIGSEGYRAIQMGRKFVGIELKESYYKQAVLNLAAAQQSQNNLLLNEPA
jgi:DNA modification methylase